MNCFSFLSGRQTADCDGDLASVYSHSPLVEKSESGGSNEATPVDTTERLVALRKVMDEEGVSGV